jgi:hypothetical protein
MEATKELNADIPAEIKKKLDLFLINTSLNKTEQKKLVTLINTIYQSGKESQ